MRGLSARAVVDALEAESLAILRDVAGEFERPVLLYSIGKDLVESSLAAAAYAWAGLFTVQSLRLIPSIVPGLIVGLPIGGWAMARVRADVFRRVCISLDA